MYRMYRKGIAFCCVLTFTAPASAAAMLIEESIASTTEVGVEEPRTCRDFRRTGSRARLVRACLTRRDWQRVYAYWGQGLGQMMGPVSPVAAVAPLDNPANRRSEQPEGRVYLEEADQN